VIVMVAWVGSLTWLGLRTWFPSAERRAATAVPVSVSPAAAYYSLSVGGATVGFASLTLDTTVTTIDVTEMIDVRLPAGDSIQRIVQRSRSTFDRSLNFQSSEVSRAQSGHRIEMKASRSRDSTILWLTSAETGHTFAAKTAVRRGPLGPAAALPLLVVALRKPRPGMVRALGLIDPFGRRIENVEVAILAESTLAIPDSAALDSATATWSVARSDTSRAWRIERRGGGAPVHMWVDEDGLPVSGELLPGLVAERQPFEIATAMYKQAAAEGMRSVPRGAATNAATSKPPVLSSMTVRLAHVTIDSVGWKRSALPGGYQRLNRDTLVIAAPDSGTTDTDQAGGTQWDAFIPGDRVMRAPATTIVGGDTSKAVAAERLVRWVNREIALAPSAPVASPAGALQTRRGDVAEKAALFVALARAAGLEARLVAGLVAQDHAWEQHTWAEVKLGSWVPADPTFGTFPAGAAYVRLTVGDPADPLYLLPLAVWLAPERLTRQKAR
jgi:hypothetical protein